MSDETTMAYAARFPGLPGFGAVCVDRSEYQKYTAKDIAAWVRKGATIERVALDAARAGMMEYLDAKIAQKRSEPARNGKSHSQRMADAGFKRRKSGKSAGGLMREE